MANENTVSRRAALAMGGAALGAALITTPAQAAEHPHIHDAYKEVGEAIKELEEAKHNFGGHKEKALVDLKAAHHQLKVIIDFLRK